VQLSVGCASFWADASGAPVETAAELLEAPLKLQRWFADKKDEAPKQKEGGTNKEEGVTSELYIPCDRVGISKWGQTATR